MCSTLSQLNTPCLLLDRVAMEKNQARMGMVAIKRGCHVRPHLKTTKSIELVRHILPTSASSITVSTLKEAEEFARAGFKDIFYALGITPQKLDHVTDLRKAGIDLKILIDGEVMADVVAAKSRETGVALPAFIEIDVDGHRAGIPVGQVARLVDVGKRLERGGRAQGVMAHAGASYDHADEAERRKIAIQEAEGTVTMAKVLRQEGIECPSVSIGSTPTALQDVQVDGVTELRAGAYLFFDLMLAGIGVCGIEDIALTVLTTVNGWNEKNQCLLVDAGWMALSSDLGTEHQDQNQYYGLVCDEQGQLMSDLVVKVVNQEHGVISVRPGASGKTPLLPIGTRLRILPIHACDTAAQHNGYHVLDENDVVTDFWPRFGGW